MRVLLTAPYIGEIGWELMCWQARVRKTFYTERCDHLVVLGAPGKSAFYEDMPGEYVEVDLSAVPGSACEDRRAVGPNRTLPSAAELRDLVSPIVRLKCDELCRQEHDVRVLWPDYDGTIYPCDARFQTFVRLNRPHADHRSPPWVVMVRRSRAFGHENWPADSWSELADRLRRHGIHTSVYPCESGPAIEAASHCDLAVGQSTGGMHLASLCGCPHVVWSVNGEQPKYQMQMTDRQRYEFFWNPLATPVLYRATTRHPTPAEVESWVHMGLARMGRRTGSSLRRLQFRRRWRVKDWIHRRVIERESFRQWPWPVQRFVRWELV